MRDQNAPDTPPTDTGPHFKFSIPEGGYYRFTLKLMPIEGGQPREYQKVVKAKTLQDAQGKFNKWLQLQA